MSLPLLNPYFDLWCKAREQPEIRKQLIWAYSWAVPSTEAIQEISRHSPILEMGAGTGYWGWLVQQSGAEITCIDSRTEAPPHWVTVHKGTPQTTAKDPELRGRTLLLVWPPLADSGSNCMALGSLRELSPKKVIYVGEWRGRTASVEFHDFLESRYRLEREVPLPAWPGFGDSLRVYCQD